MTDWFKALGDAGKKLNQKRRASPGADDAAKSAEDQELESLMNADLGELRGRKSKADRQGASFRVYEPPSPWRSLWLAELVRQLGRADSAKPSSSGHVDAMTANRQTDELVAAVFEVLECLSGEFSTMVGARVCISMTKPSAVREFADAETRIRGAEPPEGITYFRCRASNSALSLSVRGKDGIVEFFLLPVSEIFLLSQAETESRLKARLRFDAWIPGGQWTLDGFPMDEPELKVLVRNMFKDFVLRSVAEIKAEVDTHGIALHLEGERLTQAIRELVLERENLLHKIMIQQEEIQNRIARDLHDVVIADVMMMKRSLSGEKLPAPSEIIAICNRLNQRLREICHDLAPRDLRDWGLATVIEDLLNRMEDRTGAECMLNCDEGIPELPSEVQLHVFRIVKECLNNVEKYAKATRVAVNVGVEDDTLTFEIKDDGIGFDVAARVARRGQEGGAGMGSMRERTELIRNYYPARLSVDSRISGGTTTSLEIKLSGTFDDL